MNNRGRQQPWKRTESSGPRFCSRCGGALTSQGVANPMTVCRCSKDDRNLQNVAGTEPAEGGTGQ